MSAGGRPEPDTPAAWLLRANSDLALARAALAAAEVLPEDVCFHAQQCAEKAVKALLVHHGVAFPRTHAIEALFDLLEEQAGEHVPEEVDQAFELSQYATQTRYPGDWEPITDEEVEEAISQAERVLRWAEQRIAKSRGKTGR